MDNKQLEEAVENIKNFYGEALYSKDAGIVTKGVQTLLSLAQLFLSVGKEMPKKKDFEDYLMEKHAEQYIGTKDCMIDDFNKWVQDLGVDELIEYANKFNNLCHDEFTAWLVGRMEGIALCILQHTHDGSSPNSIATAIKTMIMGEWNG